MNARSRNRQGCLGFLGSAATVASCCVAGPTSLPHERIEWQRSTALPFPESRAKRGAHRYVSRTDAAIILRRPCKPRDGSARRVQCRVGFRHLGELNKKTMQSALADVRPLRANGASEAPAQPALPFAFISYANELQSITTAATADVIDAMGAKLSLRESDAPKLVLAEASEPPSPLMTRYGNG